MSRLILSVIIIFVLSGLSCARYQNTDISISPINEITIKYRMGNIESKHNKELEEFIRNKYKDFLTENEEAPIIKTTFVHLKSRKPSALQNLITAFSIGFVRREFSVDVRCILQIIKNNQILSESRAEGTGKVESWGYFAAFKEQDETWGLEPAELEAEKRAFALALENTLLIKK